MIKVGCNAVELGKSSGVGGSTTFEGLSDKATADIPAINVPLATALSDKEATANKKTDVDANNTSDTFFPTVKAVVDWVSGLFVKGGTSSTDNAIARFDGTTGKLVQNSGVTITDAGNVGIRTTNPAATLDVKGGGATSATTSLLVKNSSDVETLKLNDSGDLTLKNSLILSDGIYCIKNNLGVNLLASGGGTTNFYSNTNGFNIYNSNGSQVLLNMSNAKVVRYIAPDLQLWADSTPSRAVKINNTSGGDRFSFSSFNGTSWSGEQLVVTHTGNVGIGSTSPTAKLDVNGTSRFRNSAAFNGQIIDSAGSVGTDGQVLKNVGGLPVWSNP